MQVKIDTSERFHVITILENSLSANMTEELVIQLYSVLKETVKNVVLNWKEVSSCELNAINKIIGIQEDFYSQRVSFVNCCLQSSVKDLLSKAELLEIFNTTPTESEAIDIIQMEEIERELEEE